MSGASGGSPPDPSTEESERRSVSAILAIVSLPSGRLTRIAAGSTSVVWRLDSGGEAWVVRLGAPRVGKRTRFAVDAAVRARLAATGCPVAEPIATNQSVADPVAGVLPGGWAVDRVVPGTEARTGAIPCAAFRDLGALIAHLHALPVTGWGLLQDRADVFAGTADDAEAGLATRFERPWPFVTADLAAHPLATAAPALLPDLAPLRDRLVAAATAAPLAIQHTDLHAGQMFLADGRLTGLIDFGDPTAAPAAFDAGAVAYFHGWDAVGPFLDGYAAGGLRPPSRGDIAAMAILLAMHHVSRAQTLGLGERRERASRFIAVTLERGELA